MISTTMTIAMMMATSMTTLMTQLDIDVSLILLRRSSNIDNYRDDEHMQIRD
jgi:hypothetical protein